MGDVEAPESWNRWRIRRGEFQGGGKSPVPVDLRRYIAAVKLCRCGRLVLEVSNKVAVRGRMECILW